MKPKGNTEKWIVCRVCLQQPTTGLQSIFHQDDEQDLTLMILECGGVPIKKFDHYPDKICSKCLKYLKVAYKFRTTCQRSHKHLSRFIAPVDVDSEEHQMIALVDEDGIEELELKVEPKDVKEEIENEMVLDMFDVFEDETEEFIQEDKTEEAEYLDELENELFANTSDEEYVPETKKTTQRKIKAKEIKSENVSDHLPIIKKEKSIRGPKIRIPKQKQTSYICDVCGNIYPTQGRLNEHIKVHKGIKPYDCEICGHAFAQTQQLTRHMNTHTGQRPYKCSYCPAAFADLSTRNKHHRIHTNERPYVCDVCGKSFTYTNTLKVHKMIHTGEKPHVCDVCGKGFKQATKLRKHKFTHFKNQESETKEKIVVELVDIDDNDGDYDAIHLLGM